MAKVFYSDNQVREFIDTAKEIGISPAMRQLNYPASWATARKWFEQAGEELPTVDSLMAKAAELRLFYGDKEKKLVAMASLDRIMEKLQQDALTADDLNKLANALNKIVQTFNLIDGKATSVTESRQKDGTDLAIIDMLNEAKARNAAIEQDISEPN